MMKIKVLREIMKEIFNMFILIQIKEVVNIFRKYDLVVLPVLDDEKKMLVGIVTVDDVMDVMVDETSEKIFSKMAAVEPHDKVILKHLFLNILNIVCWLLVLMFSA